jgi:TRAP-type C4-dicarboxylate transport system permease small subunit
LGNAEISKILTKGGLALSNETKSEGVSEFKSSPLYAMLKAIGSIFKSKDPSPLSENSGHIGDDDFSKFLKVDRVVRKILRFFCWLSAIALIIIMGIAFINVIGEKLRSAGVSWARGIANSNYLIQYFHIPLVFLAAGYVTLDQGHTRIDLLIQKFPKVEKFFMAVGHILGAFLGFFISYRGVTVTLAKDFAKNMRIAATATSPKAWPFTVCHCVGFFLLGCSFVWALVRLIRFWKYDGVNPGVYLYPEENHGAPGEAEAIEDTTNEGGAEA